MVWLKQLFKFISCWLSSAPSATNWLIRTTYILIFWHILYKELRSIRVLSGSPQKIQALESSDFHLKTWIFLSAAQVNNGFLWNSKDDFFHSPLSTDITANASMWGNHPSASCYLAENGVSWKIGSLPLNGLHLFLFEKQTNGQQQQIPLIII